MLIIWVSTAYIVRDLLSRLTLTRDIFQRICQGNLQNNIINKKNDEVGDLLRSLDAMQNKLHSDISEERKRSQEMERVNVALDNASVNIMIADANHDIVYINGSLQSMFRKIEAEIRSSLPDFKVDELIGSNIDQFHKSPHKQRGQLADMKGPLNAEFSIGGRILRFIATPVMGEDRERLGTVVEWLDKTEQIKTERNVQELVHDAKQGQLSKRLETQGKEGFFLRLSNSMNELLEVTEGVISESVSCTKALSSGDLTQTINGNYEGAFADLQHHFNSSLQQLTTMIAQIGESSQMVSQGAGEISQGNNSLSMRTQQQAATLERSASSMVQINSTIQSNAENAVEASNIANAARDKAEMGGRVIGETIDAMDKIQESNGRISEITDMIDEIAFQTNLLALNAAVEAASAGDQGRGFAVVASEVRQLAGRSAEAANEVQSLVNDNLEKVGAGIKLVRQSGETLKEIITESYEVSKVIAEISTASQEQAAGVQEINTTITQLDTATQENAALVEETSAASMNLMSESRDLSAMLNEFTTVESSNRNLSPREQLHPEPVL